MFGWLKDKDWGSSPAHLLLLSRFRSGDSPGRYRDAKDWKVVLQEKPGKAIERFLGEEVLEPAGLREVMDYNFKASELKAMAKKRGLKVSGRKKEVIQRLIENDEDSMRDATKGLVVYRCTTEGEQIVEHYLDGENAKKPLQNEKFLGISQGRISRMPFVSLRSTRHPEYSLVGLELTGRTMMSKQASNR